jgi:hypothetical protein
MPNGDLEQRVAALESQAGGGGGQAGGQAGGGEGVEAFLSGALAAYAASQQQGQAQGLQAGGQAGGGQGLFGWNPTRYDSFFWCRSRFMCNPQSISCLC